MKVIEIQNSKPDVKSYNEKRSLDNTDGLAYPLNKVYQKKSEEVPNVISESRAWNRPKKTIKSF